METRARDEVRFEVPHPANPTIEIWVNGHPLAEHAGNVERVFDPSLAGSYEGLHPGDVGSIHHFLGRPRLSWFGDGDTVLLGCGCGTWAAGPLTAKVVVMHDAVRWSHVRTGHLDWDLGDLGPFEFARDDYGRALFALGAHLPE